MDERGCCNRPTRRRGAGAGQSVPPPPRDPPTPLFRNLIFGVIAQEDAQHLSHPQGLNDVIDNDLLFELHQARTTHDRSEYKI